jgi:hypothetical protein
LDAVLGEAALLDAAVGDEGMRQMGKRLAADRPLVVAVGSVWMGKLKHAPYLMPRSRVDSSAKCNIVDFI